MIKRYLDETGLEEVALHVNSRLKTVTTMPVTADEGAVRLYVGPTTSSFIKGHTYLMRTTLEQRLKFQADEYTYYMTEAGEITTTAPASYSPQVEDVPTVDEATGATIVYMAGNNALVQRIADEVSTITVDFNKIKSHVVPWWTAGASTGSYNPYTVRNVTLISLTEWVDITPSGSILNVASSSDLLTAWTQMDEDSTAIVNVTTAFALNADYNIPVGRHFLLKGGNADKSIFWTNDGRTFTGLLEASVLVWTELHDDTKLTKVNALPSDPSIGDIVLYDGTTVGENVEGHIYKYKDLTQHYTGAEVDGTYYDMNGNEIATPTDPEYSTSITVSEDGYVLCVDSAAGKLFAKKTEDDTTYSVTMNNDGTFTVGDAYVPESSAEATAGNIATWSIEEFGWVDLTPNTEFNSDDFDVSDSNEVSLVGSVKKIFEGTEEEFLDLPVAERKKYDEIHSPDGLDESQITDSITDGDMRAVTSNAVAQVVPSNASASNKLVARSETDLRVDLTGNIDLNDYFANGKYIARNGSEYTLTNAPSDLPYPNNGFSLEVMSYGASDGNTDAFCTQILTAYTSNTVWIRNRSWGSNWFVWSSWQKLATTDWVSVNNYIKHTHSDLSAVGWYKIAKLTPANYGSSIIVNLTSTYNYFHDTAMTFVISNTDTSVNCTVLSKAGYEGVFTKARVINDYVEVYYDAQGTTNSVDAIIMISECSAGQTQIENFVADSTETGGTEWVLNSELATVSTPQNGLITITSVSGSNANATTTYTNVGVGDLVNVVIDSGVLFIPSWWGTVSGLSSLGITNIQNIQGISGECRILARVCKNIDDSIYLDFLRDSGVATINNTDERIRMRRFCQTSADSVIQIARTVNFQVPTSDIAKMEMKAIKSDGSLLWDGYVTATGAHGSMVITNTKWAGSSSNVQFNEWGTPTFANDEVASIFELTNLSI